jgi:transketolase
MDLRDAQIAAYIELVQEGADLVYLVSDSVSTSKVKAFRELFPRRVVNAGIAEQNLMGMAAGLANGGLIPVTGNAAPFLVSRSNEQLKVDISYSLSNVKVNGMHAGFSYGADGITHHELNDIGVLRGMPGFEIYAPCDPRECRLAARYGVLERKGPVYTSLYSGPFPVITPPEYVFVPGRPVQFACGNDVTIVALGSAVHDALAAAEALKGAVSAAVFAVTSIRPVVGDTILSSIRNTGRVLTVEQHSTHGGVGSLMAALVAEAGLGAKLRRLGVPEGVFSQNAGAAANKAHFKLDAEGIKEAVRGLCAGN